MKKGLKKVIAFMMALVMCLSMTNVSVYAEETKVTETGVSESAQSDWDGVTTASKYVGENYNVSFTLTSHWTGGYNANIKVENTGDSVIENWYLSFALDNTLTSLWNAEVISSEAGQYVVKNAGWNADIPVGGSVAFGISVNEDFKGFPTVYSLLGESTQVQEEAYSIEYILDSDWGARFTARILVTNNTETTIEDWTLEFDFDRTITNIWNGVIESHENNHYVIKNAGYNSNIEPKQCVSLGFEGTVGIGEDIPTNYNIYSYGVSADSTDNLDYNDSDEDGLLNFYEDAIGTDKNNIDSDGDGLPDGYEVFTLQSYPNKTDSDGDGILDGYEDDDEDKLTNLKEYELVIDPKDVDTDGDGLVDNLELVHGMNPNDQDTLDDGIYDGDRKFFIDYVCETSDNSAITPYLSIELLGSQLDSLVIEKIEDDSVFLNSSISGYLGNGYSFSVDGTFEEALLSFELGKEIVENIKELQPTIYYWNEEAQLLEEVEGQYIDGNRICAKLKHFSDYIVLSKDEYGKGAFRFKIEAPVNDEYVNQTFDVSLVLDESGSISSSNYALMKQECISLIKKLADADRIAIFTFDDEVRKKVGFSTKTVASSVLSTLSQNNGLTAIYDAINIAEEEHINSSEDNVAKIMILVTDGYDNSSSNRVGNVIQKAKSNNIVIYTIGVGSVNETILNTIANSTGGFYYHISGFSQLDSVFEQIIIEADLYKDSDDDGLSDYYEKKIAAGDMHTGSGQSVGNFSILSYLNPDSDGDGIYDGAEVAIKELPSGENYYCYLYSNPCMVDSDSDGYDDYVEEYIGTSPILKRNIVRGNVEMLALNTWDEWKEMMDAHSWNYIHNLVQIDIQRRYEQVVPELYLKIGRADLHHIVTEELWEVKPASYAREPKTTQAINQLMRYVNSDPKYKVGGSLILGNSFENDEYTISYINMNNGLIIYNFQKKNPKEAFVPVKEKEKESGYIYTQKVTVDDYEVWGIIGGILLIGGTIAEDVLTGGVGTANDGASIAFALKLILN